MMKYQLQKYNTNIKLLCGQLSQNESICMLGNFASSLSSTPFFSIFFFSKNNQEYHQSITASAKQLGSRPGLTLGWA